jgi:hypothetical protein
MRMTERMTKQLHFRTGIMGSIAAFFVARRASGFPSYDETVVLPAVAIIALMRLYDRHRIGFLVGEIGVVVVPLGAGLWLGAYFGPTLRSGLRGALTGVVVGAGYAALNGTLDRQQYRIIAGQFVAINYFFYFFGSLFIGVFREFAVTSESDWQYTAPRRARGYKLYRTLAQAEKLEGAPNSIVIAYWTIKIALWLIPSAWLAYQLGLNPFILIQNKLLH